ncbi:MAG: carboxypeptidase-like regulatory domain-containing protein [Terracidiphilus sp.]
MRRNTRQIVYGVLGFLLTTASCFAQFNANVQGTVLDPKGNAIPGAKVTLINSQTGVQQQTTNDSTGFYRFDSLAPGDYSVSTTVSGFEPATVTFSLTTDQTREVPLNLKIQATSSTVTVNTEEPLIDTSDSRFEQTLDTAAVTDLPLAGRNPTNVITIAPGVTGTGGQNSPGSSTSTNFAPENWVNASANGQGATGNQYVVDGMDVTSTIRPGVLNLTPNADTVQEISVQTNTYTVDFGRAASIQTVMTTKSGTNEFHGVASEYYQYQNLAARGEFGVPQPIKVNPYHVNNLSFALGGPVIPHKQFFFFVGYEPYLSLASNGTSLDGFEDPAFVTFAEGVEPNSPEVELMQKYPVAGMVNVKQSATAGDLWGNTLPTTALQQACASGTGNVTAFDDISVPCSLAVFDTGNFNSSSYYNAKQYNIRMDKYFPKDRAYGQFFRDTINNGGPSPRPAFAETDKFFTFSLQGNETHTFTPNTLNEAMFGYNRIEGIAPATGLYTVPIVNVTNLGTGWGDGFADGDYIQHSYHWRDVLTHIVGHHSIKGGFEAWRSNDIALFAGCYDQPSFSFNNMIDMIANNPYSESGISFNPVSGAYDSANYGYKETTMGIFAEDSWKVNRRLTVNYGLRYDNFGNPYVALAGTVLANFHLASGSTFADQVTNGIMKQQSHVFNHDINWVFSPRGGVAYDLVGDGKWVLRGGFGLFHNEFTLGNAENGLKGNPPGYIVPTFYNNGSTAAPIFGYGTQNKVPFGFPAPAFVGQALDAKGGIAGAQNGVGGTDPQMTAPDALDWSAGLEHQLTPNVVASVGYEGSHGYNLISAGGNVGNTTYGVDVNIFPGDLIQHPAFNSSGVWTGDGIQTRLNTSFGSINYAFNATYSNYYAFIAAVKGKLGQHGFLTASYTRSAAKDDWNNYPEGYVGGGGTSYNFKQYYSPSPWDAPNRFSMGISYDIPGVRTGNGFVRRLTNGFNLSETTILQSGNPFFVYSGNALSLVDTTGVTVTEANYASELAAGNFAFAGNSGNYSADGDNYNIPNVTSYSQKHNRKAYQYTGVVDSGVITHSQFAQPAFSSSGTEGNEKIDQFRNPGYADTDFTVKKTTLLAERINLELRMDAFNLFNRVNLNGVDTNYNDTSANFGTTSGTSFPRYLQLAARITF